jgi:hypothetical protein
VSKICVTDVKSHSEGGVEDKILGSGARNGFAAHDAILNFEFTGNPALPLVAT